MSSAPQASPQPPATLSPPFQLPSDAQPTSSSNAPRTPSNTSALTSTSSITVSGALAANGGNHEQTLEAVVKDRNQLVDENSSCFFFSFLHPLPFSILWLETGSSRMKGKACSEDHLTAGSMDTATTYLEHKDGWVLTRSLFMYCFGSPICLAGLWKIIRNLQNKVDASRSTETRLRNERDRALANHRLHRAVSPPNGLSSAPHLPSSYSSLGLGIESNNPASSVNGPHRSSMVTHKPLVRRQYSEEGVRSMRREAGDGMRERLESNTSLASADTFTSAHTDTSFSSGGAREDEWESGLGPQSGSHTRSGRNWRDLDIDTSPKPSTYLGLIQENGLASDSKPADTIDESGFDASQDVHTRTPTTSTFNGAAYSMSSDAKSSSLLPQEIYNRSPFDAPTIPRTPSGRHSLSSPISLSKDRQREASPSAEPRSTTSSKREFIGRSILDVSNADLQQFADYTSPTPAGLSSLSEESSVQRPTYVISVSSPDQDRKQRPRSRSASVSSPFPNLQASPGLLETTSSEVALSPLAPFSSSATTSSQTSPTVFQTSDLGDEEPMAPSGTGKELQKQQHLAMREQVPHRPEQGELLVKEIYPEDYPYAHQQQLQDPGKVPVGLSIVGSPLVSNSGSGSVPVAGDRSPQASEFRTLPLNITHRQQSLQSSPNPSTSLARPNASPLSSVHSSYDKSTIESANSQTLLDEGARVGSPLLTGQPQPVTVFPSPSSQTVLSYHMLSHTKISIPSCGVMTNEYGRDVVRFRITISISPPGLPSSPLPTGLSQKKQWKVDKLFSDFLALDNSLRKKMGRKETKALGIPSLPEAKAWKEFSMGKVDQRKARLLFGNAHFRNGVLTC